MILKKYQIILIVLILQLFCIQQNMVAQDSVAVSTVKHRFQADPMRATMLAVVFPGLGQIYNRKYWKIPLVYAGLGSLVYAIGFNSSHYTTYLQAFQDYTDDIPATRRYEELPGLKGLDPVLYDREKNFSTYTYYRDQMLRMVDYYKRYRDLSYIGIAGWYLVSILDANVDASLFNYDISDNLDIAVFPMHLPLSGGYLVTGINVSVKVNF